MFNALTFATVAAIASRAIAQEPLIEQRHVLLCALMRSVLTVAVQVAISLRWFVEILSSSTTAHINAQQVLSVSTRPMALVAPCRATTSATPLPKDLNHTVSTPSSTVRVPDSSIHDQH